MKAWAWLSRLLGKGAVTLLAAFLLLVVALVIPRVKLAHDTYDYIVIFDITQSMDVEDYEVAGTPVSRLTYARNAVQSVLRELPCGSRVGWGAFAEYRSLLLLAPVEVCDNYNDLIASLANIDGRMRWANASEVGKGSTFTLYLPRVSGENRPLQLPAEDAPPAGGRGMSVLVVEDNIEVGTFAADALAELGYSAILAGNAIDALAELAKNAERFDVVFSDVVMPGMTGIELAQEIRRRHFDLPIVLTSGYSHVLSQQGRYGFELLQKPYSIEQLSRALQKVGRRRKLKRGAAE